ncbi:translation initiation factor IF-3 [Marinitoga sp. 1135]|uniref:translation initiation factor IF-3 n=1 Tax=unclassified Marinitoga TaxID=2640159 RepID=UPI00059EE3A1|nr:MULTISPECIES: translation initiation factor IF-3 [Marinitoga]APT76564.1 translation initiation factor IF-3 [Marinitoga sp. 1137]NUU96332.1 translation initiation factor IF-3 [Marinitoga sp. 1135]NUU98250.1 translation initiation factor IF-3 [Marinitoga sp. 1138]
MRNEDIKAKELRVIGSDGSQLGIMETKKALQLAYQEGLDLVLVAPNSNPPVAKIMDYGKYKYEKEKREKEAKKKQKKQQLKEMKFRLRIDEHDFNTKVKRIRDFLEAGNKVRAVVMFLGRDIMFTDKGKEILDRVIEKVEDIAEVTRAPKMAGRDMDMILSPKTKK